MSPSAGGTNTSLVGNPWLKFYASRRNTWHWATALRVDAMWEQFINFTQLARMFQEEQSSRKPLRNRKGRNIQRRSGGTRG